MISKTGTLALAAMVTMGIAKPAAAQDYGLHYAHAGALLEYAQFEAKVLYAAVTAREYDPKITKDTLEELKRALGEAKRHVGRSATLLPEKLMKHEAAVEKLRASLGKAEAQLAKLAKDIDEQTKSLFADEAEVELGERSEEPAEAEPAAVDWKLLKTGVGWLATDIKSARGTHKSLARKIKVKTLKTAPKPRGKRPG